MTMADGNSEREALAQLEALASAGGAESPDDTAEPESPEQQEAFAYLEALAREVIAQFGPGQDGFTRFRICARSAYRQDVSARAGDTTVKHYRADPDAVHAELRAIFSAAAQEYLAAYDAGKK
jgi:hypothetical protein